jgi:hypothetical protein
MEVGVDKFEVEAGQIENDGWESQACLSSLDLKLGHFNLHFSIYLNLAFFFFFFQLKTLYSDKGHTLVWLTH